MLLHHAKTDGLQVLMVTSAVGGEGKTTVASQWRRAWPAPAQDATDRRRPQPGADKPFELPPGAGPERGAARRGRPRRRGAADVPVAGPANAPAAGHPRRAGPGPARCCGGRRPRLKDQNRVHHRRLLPGAAGGRRPAARSARSTAVYSALLMSAASPRSTRPSRSRRPRRGRSASARWWSAAAATAPMRTPRPPRGSHGGSRIEDQDRGERRPFDPRSSILDPRSLNSILISPRMGSTSQS